ncbi:MAG: glycosyltransferase family 4 protein [Lachnospiraceae bacterium]|nr:glycosyltransferase family 4 protein [Lachnospiraceae bacterium]
MKLYIDVTNYRKSTSVSGIQRVLCEIVQELEKNAQVELQLLEECNGEEILYRCIPLHDAPEEAQPCTFRPLTDARPGEIWLDLDSVWHNGVKRSNLYPLLHRRGVRIVSYLYDLIPVRFPQYVEEMTGVRFRAYLAAVLQHADLILSETQAGIRDIQDLERELEEQGLKRVVTDRHYAHTWLGYDFAAKEEASEPAHRPQSLPEGALVRASVKGRIRPEVQKLLASKAPYVLMVGTIEPRKNHRLLLDAFEAKDAQGRTLYNRGIRLVIAGKWGWDVEDLRSRIEHSGYLHRELLLVERAADQELQALYGGAGLCAVPSYAEGFGLPIVEALSHGVPVVTGTHPVLRETGGDLCAVTDPDDPKHLRELLDAFFREEPGTEPEAAQQAEPATGDTFPGGSAEGWKALVKSRAEEFTSESWEKVTVRLMEALEGLRDMHVPSPASGTGEGESDKVSDDPPGRAPSIAECPVLPPSALHQMVILTARAKDLLSSLPYMEQNLPFLTELVLCCPARMVPEMEAGYHGRLKLIYLTDEELLKGRSLPADHAVRNMFLRGLAFAREQVDTVFLMGDDDYRPLHALRAEDFYAAGGTKYMARICHDLLLFPVTQGGATSFDESLVRCGNFLAERGMPTFMCDSHTMQVMDKRYFLEMTGRFPRSMEQSIVTEWSGPYNYMAWAYPGTIEMKPYHTLNWPGFDEDWEPLWRDVDADPSVENYYETAYVAETFYEHPGRLYGIDPEDSAAKAERERQLIGKHAQDLTAYEEWKADFVHVYGVDPVYAVAEDHLIVPPRMRLLAGGFVRICFDLRFALRGMQRAKPLLCPETQYQLIHVVTQRGLPKLSPGSSRFYTGDGERVNVLLRVPDAPGMYLVEWTLYAQRELKAVTELEVAER